MLAAAEKRLLIWMAHRLPRWVNSDHLTALGAVAMVGTAAGLCGGLARRPMRWRWCPRCLAVNWFGDSLDGTVARVRNQQRPRYGFYLDHVVDIANTAVLFAGLALSGLCSPWIAMALLVGYLLLCGESFLATHALGVFRISFAGMGPTELRILLSVGALAAMAHHAWCTRSGSARSSCSTSAASSAPSGWSSCSCCPPPATRARSIGPSRCPAPEPTSR